jgi:hypothetical protein
MKMSKCPDCGQTYRVKSGGHCRGGAFGGCCRTFASDSAADAHRKGPYSGKRVCVDFDDDYNSKGRKVEWRQNQWGEWTNAPSLPRNVWRG